jgi:hypothetical protein
MPVWLRVICCGLRMLLISFLCCSRFLVASNKPCVRTAVVVLRNHRAQLSQHPLAGCEIRQFITSIHTCTRGFMTSHHTGNMHKDRFVKQRRNYSLYSKLFTSLIYGSRLGGVVVSALATGPKGCGFEPGQGVVYLSAIKIRSTPSPRMGSKAGRAHVVRF